MKRTLAAAVGVLLLGTLVARADLVVNGNFSSGNSGFSTDYTLVPANGTVSTQPGQYGLTDNPATGFTNGFASYTDHTGDAAGLMLLADGAAATYNVWSEVISVSPGTTYSFSSWVASADALNTATLSLFVNGVATGSSFAAPTTAGVWAQWQQTFVTAPSVTSITLSIRDVNPTPQTAGNDFTLDDISLNGPANGVPEPATLTLLATGCAAIFTRRRRWLR
ncbi:MAG: PEP-CTERM sorting domain-containing protein [Terriglobales bacterium]